MGTELEQTFSFGTECQGAWTPISLAFTKSRGIPKRNGKGTLMGLKSWNNLGAWQAISSLDYSQFGVHATWMQDQWKLCSNWNMDSHFFGTCDHCSLPAASVSCTRDGIVLMVLRKHGVHEKELTTLLVLCLTWPQTLRQHFTSTRSSIKGGVGKRKKAVQKAHHNFLTLSCLL